MKFWPGTNIVKSTGNAFDWRNTPSEMLLDRGQRMQSNGLTIGQTATRTREIAEQDGKRFSVIAGISRKSDNRMASQQAPQKLHVFKRAK